MTAIAHAAHSPRPWSAKRSRSAGLGLPVEPLVRPTRRCWCGRGGPVSRCLPRRRLLLPRSASPLRSSSTKPTPRQTVAVLEPTAAARGRPRCIVTAETRSQPVRPLPPHVRPAARSIRSPTAACEKADLGTRPRARIRWLATWEGAAATPLFVERRARMTHSSTPRKCSGLPNRLASTFYARERVSTTTHALPRLRITHAYH